MSRNFMTPYTFQVHHLGCLAALPRDFAPRLGGLPQRVHFCRHD
jgi:hypothetical protein